MTPFLRIVALAAVAVASLPSAVAARQAPPLGGSEDKNPSGFTIIMSLAVLVDIELMEKHCSIAEPARAADYHGKARQRFEATDPGFLALLRSSDLYPPLLSSGQARYAGMDRPMLLAQCEAFLQQP